MQRASQKMKPQQKGAQNVLNVAVPILIDKTVFGFAGIATTNGDFVFSV
jgi:hypothetical protein